jgi:sugar lactone lactonase YvrE
VLKIQGPVIIDVTGNLTIQGSARIVVSKGHNPDLDGSAQIYVAGNLNIGGGGGGGGGVYVADTDNHTIRTITPTWTVATLAGLVGVQDSTDGTGSVARFHSPGGMAVDDAGNIYVADTANHTIRTITPAGAVTTLAGSAGPPGSADGTCSDARFSAPKAVAVDNAENDNSGSDNKRIVYVADTNNHTIRKITPADGVVTTLAGLAGVHGSADGTGSAQFYSPGGVAVDGTGNVYVADTDNDTIRKVTPAGVVTTLAGSAGVQGNADGTGSAARFNSPDGVAVDDAGYVYVADTANHTIRKITPVDGVVTTLAGAAGVPGSADGTGSDARFNSPGGVAVDDAGNVYVADTDNHTIRKITPAGVVTTLAGAAGALGSANGPGGDARFNRPTGLAVDCWGINNLTRRPRKLAIFCSSNSSSPGLTTTNDLYGFYGTVYAPNSPLVVNGDPRIYGALVGQSVTFNGTPTIHYDLDLRKAAFSVVNTPYDVWQWVVSN